MEHLEPRNDGPLQDHEENKQGSFQHKFIYLPHHFKDQYSKMKPLLNFYLLEKEPKPWMFSDLLRGILNAKGYEGANKVSFQPIQTYFQMLNQQRVQKVVKLIVPFIIRSALQVESDFPKGRLLIQRKNRPSSVSFTDQ